MNTKRWWVALICCIPHSLAVILIALGVGIGTWVIGFQGDQAMGTGLLFAVLMGIACPIVMGLTMWLIFKDMRPTHPSTPPVSAADRLAMLKEQRQQLENEIAELTAIAQLEAQHQGLSSYRATGEPSQVN